MTPHILTERPLDGRRESLVGTARKTAIARRGILTGLALFLIHNLALWAGWIAPPAGFRPLLYIQSPDANQYLGFLALARDHALFPDLHAPWSTEPAMLNPLFLICGRMGAWLGASPVAALNALQLLTSVAVGCVLVWVLRVLLPNSSQRVAAVAVTVCALPPMMLALGAVRFLAPSTAPFFWLGTVELSYMSADGLFRGGLSNGPGSTIGTAMLLLALGLSAMRLRTGRRVYSWLVALAVLVSALLHPFEVFVMAPAAVAGFLLLGPALWADAGLVALGAASGLAPYLWLSLHHPWFRELSETFRADESLARIILAYGIPVLAVPYLLLMGSRPKDRCDKLLLLWWLWTIGISVLPGAPFPPHLLDGFALVTGVLVARLGSTPKLRRLYDQHPRGLKLALGAALGLAGVAYAGMYVQIARDARSGNGGFLLSSVAAEDDVAILDDFRSRASTDDLALAPEPLSMMLVRVPMHSFASHEHLSFDYPRQTAEAKRFFEASMSQEQAAEFLSGYGVRWVALPEDSPARVYLARTPEAFRRGHYHVFELSGNRMKPYPGIAGILAPEQRQPPLTERILHALGW